MGNKYSKQQTHACCETCAIRGIKHTITFLSTNTPREDADGNSWIEVYYMCSNGHLFYTQELKSNYYNRIERNNAQINKINSLKKRIVELEEIVKQHNFVEQANAPPLVVAECVSSDK